MKRVWIVLAVTALVLAGMPAVATAAPAGSGTRVVPLGWGVRNGRLMTGYAFVHAKGGVFALKGGGRSTPLYTYLASGARWRTTEAYVVNAWNPSGVPAAAIAADLDAAATAWDSRVAYQVFGSGSTTTAVLAADWDATAVDDVNEVYFGDTSSMGADTVAVTVVWGYFSGSPKTRQLLGWDMVFNKDLAEGWGDAAAPAAVWDVRGIATHEIGHAAGMGDLYTTAAAEQTMYGYASPGETKKRTLESGDIAGITALYE